MAAAIVRCLSARVRMETGTPDLLKRFVSSNRVKRIKKPEVTNRQTNEAKAEAMRAESEQLGALYAGKRFESVAQSLSSRGYLRATKPYAPPEDVETRIMELAKASNLTDPVQAFVDPQQKFNFLVACYEAFQHSVPNSVLHEIKTVGDTIRFYRTPINTTMPLDALQTVELPENLHIQKDYIRFHPETDTMFGGKTAFPKSSTVVTSLRYKSKYRGHVAKKSWP